MNVNKAFVVGNITRDPELKSLPSGVKVVSFSVATNKVWKDRDGNKQERVDFHNIVAFGATAENIAKYMRKGSHIYVEGEMQTRSWDDKDTGKKMYRTEINALNVQFGNNPNKTSGSDTSGNRTADSSAPEYPEDDISPDDIPF